MAKLKLSQEDGIFELSTSKKSYKGGDEVAGTATALLDTRRNVQIALVYGDQAGVGETAGELTVFAFELPPDPLPDEGDRARGPALGVAGAGVLKDDLSASS